MQSPLISLESIEIASPCRADWNAMQGNNCVRFCPSCGKNVYNLSAMPRDEAMRLMEVKEGNLCVRLRRRADGTVITNDCPVGAETRKRQKRGIQLLTGALGCVAALFGLRGVLAAHSPDALQTSSSDVTMGVPPELPAATPTPNIQIPSVSTPSSSKSDALGIDSPSSVTTGSHDSEQVLMGAPAPPTTTQVSDDTLKIPPSPSH